MQPKPVGTPEESGGRDAYKALTALLREKGSFWHRTRLSSIQAIFETGEIRPNAGSFSYTYPQSKTSYASALKAVALFDFDEPSDEAIADRSYAWEPFILGDLPGLLIRIDRAALDNQLLLLPSQIAAGDIRLSSLQEKTKLTIIPDLEALYLGSIPTDAFTRLVLLDHLGEGRYRFEQFDVPAGSDLVQLGMQWIAEHEMQSKARREAGELTLDDLTKEQLSF